MHNCNVVLISCTAATDRIPAHVPARAAEASPAASARAAGLCRIITTQLVPDHACLHCMLSLNAPAAAYANAVQEWHEALAGIISNLSFSLTGTVSRQHSLLGLGGSSAASAGVTPAEHSAEASPFASPVSSFPVSNKGVAGVLLVARSQTRSQGVCSSGLLADGALCMFRAHQVSGCPSMAPRSGACW